MTNDAKLGMVAGVAGVIVAAVLLSSNPPPGQSKSGEGTESHAKDRLAAQHTQPESPPAVVAPASKLVPEASTAAVAPASKSAPEANAVALPSTPVIRTRKDADAQPASRASGMDEEP